MHPFTGIQITNKGIDILCEYVAQVREVIGYEIPLAVDHFGHIGVESCIRLGKALDQFSLAWYEDMIPWQLANQWQRLAEAVDTPVCTGEDLYLKENFLPLFERRALAVVHPDLAFFRRDSRDQKDRRPSTGSRHCHGTTHGYVAGGGISFGTLRRGDRKLHGARKPLGRSA